jgi:hypothetical protein
MTEDEKSETGTVQKKLNIRPEYADALEKMAEDMYGSTYKQGRVIENLIDLTKYRPLSTQIDEWLRQPDHHGTVLSDEVESEMSIESDSDESAVHKEDQNSTESNGTQDGEPLEERLSRMKGSRSLDKGDIVEQVAKERLPPMFSKEMLAEVLQNEAGYGRSGAYNVIEEANLHEFPLDRQDLDRWARAKMRNSNASADTFAEFAGIADHFDIPYDKVFASREEMKEVVTKLYVEIEAEGDARRKEDALAKLESEVSFL